MACMFPPAFRALLAPPAASQSIFRSGHGEGWYGQNNHRHPQELDCVFSDGRMFGHGTDGIGAFMVFGTYDAEAGKAVWLKRYLGRHIVHYSATVVNHKLEGRWFIPP